MKILSHRGYWIEAAEKNGESAFRRSFAKGFGLETDVRDAGGTLVIAHDMPGGGEMTLSDFVNLAREMLPSVGTDGHLPLAINIKADGLAGRVKEIMQGAPLDWFVFDMSIPDMRQHLDAGNPVYARVSEVEPSPPWLSEAKGIWLDAFFDEWYDDSVIRFYLELGLRVCVVSPELHRRDPEKGWAVIKPLRDHPGLMICTDMPEKAQDYFFS